MAIDFSDLGGQAITPQSKIDFSDLGGVPADQSSISQDYPVRRALSRWLIRPAIVGTGMGVGGAAGAILGSPAGPAGAGAAAIGMGGAMYGPSERAADAVDQWMGIGHQEKPAGSLGKQALDSLKDWNTGMLMQETGMGVSKAIPKAIDVAVKGGIPVALGPSKEAVVARMNNPEAISGAATHDELAQRLPQTLNKIKDQVTALDNQANGVLRESANPQDGAIPASFIQGILDHVSNGLRVGKSIVGPAANKAMATLQGIKNSIGRVAEPAPTGETWYGEPLPSGPAYIPEKQVRGIIRSLDQNIDWGNQELEPLNGSLEQARTTLDTVLKGRNPQYAEIMAPEAEKLKLLKNAQKQFNISSQPGEGFVPGTATATNLKTAVKSGKGVIQDTLQGIAQETGDDYLTASKNAALRDQFIGGGANGSRRTLGGATIGAAGGEAIGHALGFPGLGSTIGASLGSAAGMAADTSGREWAGKLIDQYVKAKPWLANLPYETATRLIATGVLGPPTPDAQH